MKGNTLKKIIIFSLVLVLSCRAPIKWPFSHKPTEPTTTDWYASTPTKSSLIKESPLERCKAMCQCKSDELTRQVKTKHNIIGTSKSEQDLKKDMDHALAWRYGCSFGCEVIEKPSFKQESSNTLLQSIFTAYLTDNALYMQNYKDGKIEGQPWSGWTPEHKPESKPKK